MAQVAIAVIAAILAMMSWRSYSNLNSVDLGYSTENAWAATIDATQSMYKSPERLYLDLQTALLRMPGVESASLSVTGLFLTRPFYSRVWIDGLTGPEGSRVNYLVVGPGFFRMAKGHLLAGRDFSESDDRERPAVAIVNEAFVKRLLGGTARDGLRHFRFARRDRHPREIVGVVADPRHTDIREQNLPVVYVPLLQHGDLERVEAIVRTADGQAPRIRSVVEGVDPRVTVFDEHSLERDRLELLRPERGLAFGAVALLITALGMSCLGLYGVFAYQLSLRRRDFAIRAAMGASKVQLALTASRRLMIVIIAGSALGAAASSVGYRHLQPVMFGISRDGTAWLLAVVLATLATAMAVVLIPALRILRADLFGELRGS